MLSTMAGNARVLQAVRVGTDDRSVDTVARGLLEADRLAETVSTVAVVEDGRLVGIVTKRTSEC
jgi:CBS domain-containing protein